MPSFTTGENLKKMNVMILHDLKNDNYSFMDAIPNAPEEAIRTEGLDMNLITRTAEAQIGISAAYVDGDVLGLDVKKGTIPWQYITTKPMKTNKEEIRASLFDRLSEIRMQNSRALMNVYRQAVLHGIAPDANTAKMPLLRTTGAADSTGRKRLVLNDIIDFQSKIREVENIPDDEFWNLNLCHAHLADLLIDTKANQEFRNMYQDHTKGTPMNMYGFNFHFNGSAKVLYNAAGAKKAIGASKISTDQFASVFFWSPNVVKAVGNLTDHYKPASQDTRNNPAVDELRISGNCLGARKQDEGVAVLVSDNA